MYISTQIELTARVYCNGCGEELDADCYEKHGEIKIQVDVCRRCTTER